MAKKFKGHLNENVVLLLKRNELSCHMVMQYEPIGHGPPLRRKFEEHKKSHETSHSRAMVEKRSCR